MEILLGWIGFSLVVAWVWSARRLSFGAGLLWSLLLSPLVGLLIGLIKEPNQAAVEEHLMSTGDRKKCPFCAELIKREAIVCRFCGKDQPPLASPPDPAPLAPVHEVAAGARCRACGWENDYSFPVSRCGGCRAEGAALA